MDAKDVATLTVDSDTHKGKKKTHSTPDLDAAAKAEAAEKASRKNRKKKERKQRARAKRIAQLGGDGVNPDAGFFEGAEKLFECWWDPSTPGYKSLRTLSRADIDGLLVLAACTVVSSFHSTHVDAYLLSESSLFVYDEMIILKTCGQTTLLHVVPAFLKLCEEKCNARNLQGLWFSRKNLTKPEAQAVLHQTFLEESAFLDTVLQKRGLTGGAYLLGRLNGDHWNLYAMDNPEWEADMDCTFEILMSDLDQERMKSIFYCSSPDKESQIRLGKECTAKSGIGELLKDATLDETMFYPCGYSLNGANGRNYYTIHVTPQPQCSYASFETNCRYEDYDAVIAKLVAIFKPGRFIVNLTSEGSNVPDLERDLGNFSSRDLVRYHFGRYTMQMGHWVSLPKYARTPSALSLLDMDSHGDE